MKPVFSHLGGSCNYRFFIQKVQRSSGNFSDLLKFTSVWELRNCVFSRGGINMCEKRCLPL